MQLSFRITKIIYQSKLDFFINDNNKTELHIKKICRTVLKLAN